MDKKEIKFDLSADALLDMADARIEEGDLLAALRLLHKSIELYGPAADEYASLADVYDEMEMFEESAGCWFRYLDVCAEEEMVDGYEGLAACFYNMGNERCASYYYRKMLADKYLSPANNIEMGELFGQRTVRPSFKVVWPPESADYSEEIDEGLKAVRTGDFKKAEECFEEVHENSPYRAAAMNYLAVTCLLAGEPERAEQTCRGILEKDPDNVQALSTYAAVLTELDRPQESRAVAEKLAKLPADNADELYKIATVCCENKLYEEALEKFRILEGMVGYDRTLLFFKAVAAFRAGKTQESLAAFGKILDITPSAAVARFYFRAVRKWAEEGGEPPETSFFYRLPRAEREVRVNLLAALIKMKQAELRAYCRESDLMELFEWCFDEADGQDAELQLLGVAAAVRCKYVGFVRGILLDTRVSDPIKVEALRTVCLKNRSFTCSIVLGDIYREVAFTRLEAGREKHRRFVEAYANCFARFAVPGDSDGEVFRRAAERIYAALASRGQLDAADDANSLACAVCLAAVGADAKTARRILHLMDGNMANVARILSTLRDADTEQEVAAAQAGEEENAKKERAEEQDDGTDRL